MGTKKLDLFGKEEVLVGVKMEFSYEEVLEDFMHKLLNNLCIDKPTDGMLNSEKILKTLDRKIPLDVLGNKYVYDEVGVFSVEYYNELAENGLTVEEDYIQLSEEGILFVLFKSMCSVCIYSEQMNIELGPDTGFMVSLSDDEETLKITNIKEDITKYLTLT
ncbi:hypothetical protein [Paraclostridium bifermentans]|uniref:hypothetical protein n=1 Tax=Paraclostridium bifermentans TaxID=1490 RepID=UPI00374E316D